MTVSVKICGLRSPEDVRFTAEAGARYIGFNFFEKSPRYATPEQVRDLAAETPLGVAKVGLVVNASDAELDAILNVAPLDMLQLHGSEPPARVAEVKSRYGLPVMKVLGIASAEDAARIDSYQTVADQIMVDAKAPKDAVLPGGNGVRFDWRLLSGQRWQVPWMLAGGLTPQNVAEAVALTGARQVDVASGVESAPGEKSADLVRAFVAAAQGRAR